MDGLVTPRRITAAPAAAVALPPPIPPPQVVVARRLREGHACMRLLSYRGYVIWELLSTRSHAAND